MRYASIVAPLLGLLIVGIHARNFLVPVAGRLWTKHQCIKNALLKGSQKPNALVSALAPFATFVREEELHLLQEVEVAQL